MIAYINVKYKANGCYLLYIVWFKQGSSLLCSVHQVPQCVCRPTGKSVRLKFLMYVWNTLRGYIKLQKDFRWTVWRWNIDIMINADENQIIFMNILLFGFFQHIQGKNFRLKFLMYVWNTFRGHIKLQKDFRWTVWSSNIEIMIHADEKKMILMIF